MVHQEPAADMHLHPEGRQRRSIRLKGYDYTQSGAYFVTICIQDCIQALGTIVEEEVCLSDAGKDRTWMLGRDSASLSERVAGRVHHYAEPRSRNYWDNRQSCS
jgi:hypothetical protein